MRDGPFYVSSNVQIGQRTIFDEFRRPIADPLVRHRLVTKLGWRDRLRLLVRGTLTTEVRIDARPDALRAVMPVIDDLPDQATTWFPKPVADAAEAAR